MDKKIISTEKAPQAIGPYSQAIVANGFLFTSGMVPIDPATNQLVEGDITVQAKQAISNLKNLIEASGSSCDKVVKTTVFIKDMNQFSIINDIYKEYFNKDFPARSCVEVARLPKDVLTGTDTSLISSSEPPSISTFFPSLLAFNAILIM